MSAATSGAGARIYDARSGFAAPHPGYRLRPTRGLKMLGFVSPKIDLGLWVSGSFRQNRPRAAGLGFVSSNRLRSIRLGFVSLKSSQGRGPRVRLAKVARAWQKASCFAFRRFGIASHPPSMVHVDHGRGIERAATVQPAPQARQMKPSTFAPVNSAENPHAQCDEKCRASVVYRRNALGRSASCVLFHHRRFRATVRPQPAAANSRHDRANRL
jgi:hypothetical protein